jgi:autotransporter-associated beta strand protein
MLLAANAAALGNASGGTIVANGGTLALSNNITIAAEPLTLSGTGFNNSGALRNESGVNNFNGPLSFSGPSTIRAAGTRLTLGGSWNTLGNTHALTFDAAPSAAVFVMNGISGGGALAKTGTGMLSMYGTNTYTGSTSINEGTLLLAANASISRSAGIVLNTNAVFNVAGVSGGWVLVSGQYLQGSGIVSGSVRIAGSIYPGITLGTLTVNGQVVLQGTVVMEIRKLDGLPANDVLACTSSLTPGGILTVVNIGAEAFTAGDSFKLFDALAFGAGAFDTLNLPALPADLRWDTSKLYVDGTLRVEPAVPPSLAVAFSGGTLTLAWPGEYSSYVLEGQTNEPGQGLVPLWFPVPGVVSNSISIPVDLLNGSAFYCLGRP